MSFNNGDLAKDVRSGRYGVVVKQGWKTFMGNAYPVLWCLWRDDIQSAIRMRGHYPRVKGLQAANRYYCAVVSRAPVFETPIVMFMEFCLDIQINKISNDVGGLTIKQ